MSILIYETYTRYRSVCKEEVLNVWLIEYMKYRQLNVGPFVYNGFKMYDNLTVGYAQVIGQFGMCEHLNMICIWHGSVYVEEGLNISYTQSIAQFVWKTSKKGSIHVENILNEHLKIWSRHRLWVSLCGRYFEYMTSWIHEICKRSICLVELLNVWSFEYMKYALDVDKFVYKTFNVWAFKYIEYVQVMDQLMQLWMYRHFNIWHAQNRDQLMLKNFECVTFQNMRYANGIGQYAEKIFWIYDPLNRKDIHRAWVSLCIFLICYIHKVCVSLCIRYFECVSMHLNKCTKYWPVCIDFGMY